MSSDKILTAEMLEEEVKRQCGLILDSGVLMNARYTLRWRFTAEDKETATRFIDCLRKILPGFKYFSRFDTVVGSGFSKASPIVIDTYNFLFTEINVLNFSKMLLELAVKDNVTYDLWELLLPKRLQK